MNPRDINISDFTYELPDEKIALQPLKERDSSKLLIYNAGQLQEDLFSNIDQHLPSNSLLVFNNSKVINARLKFQKETGAFIEIFCLEPADFEVDYNTVMSRTEKVRWKCFVGGAAKWKGETLIKNINTSIFLEAILIERIHDAFIVEFRWTPPTIQFSEILSEAGDIPLPPYIKRTVSTADNERYQTIYAQQQGSVAAPTAGLHFTQAVFQKLNDKQIQHAYITLHVGAGTFKPVKSTTLENHEMHAEWIDVDIDFLKLLAKNTRSIIAVGTTSLRTVESLFWLGIKLLQEKNAKELTLGQWDVYDIEGAEKISSEIAIQGLIDWMESTNEKRLFTQTQLLITPGYTFRIANALVTNFHQPQSTLLLLVAAAIGKDWMKLYDFALKNDYRFLSYGDGNLIFL